MASVDVVVPNYRYGRYLRACVTSVLDQGIDDLRVLIIDNASDDDSVDIARQLAAEDRRVQVVARSRNLGPHASFNEGIDWAEADYLLILPSDDILLPGCLRESASFLERNPGVVFTYGEAILSYGDERRSEFHTHRQPSWTVMEGGHFIDRFCRNAFFRIANSSLVVRTSAQKAAGYYRPEIPHTDDYEMWLRLACLGDVAQTGAAQSVLRRHGANQSREVDGRPCRHLAETRVAIDSFFRNEGAGLPGWEDLRTRALHSLAARAYWSGSSNICRGRMHAARELFGFAFGLRPSMALLPPLGYLLRRDDGLGRIAHVMRHAVGRAPARGACSVQ